MQMHSWLRLERARAARAVVEPRALEEALPTRHLINQMQAQAAKAKAAQRRIHRPTRAALLELLELLELQERPASAVWVARARREAVKPVAAKREQADTFTATQAMITK